MSFLLVLWAVASPPAMEDAGAWTIEGQTSHVIHGHGSPAQLGSAVFEVSWSGRGAAELSVRDVTFVTSSDCEVLPATPAGTPKVLGLRRSRPGSQPLAPMLRLAPGEATVRVSFEPVEASTTHCDRFGFRVTFDAGGKAIVAMAETELEREFDLPE